MTKPFIIHQWHCWPPLSSETQTAVEQQKTLLASVPKMLRRRLTPLAKTVFCAILQQQANYAEIPIVFSSSHGELEKSLRMMEMIEDNQEISPTQFSLSVHNAIAGLFSIAFNNKQQISVLAPGEDGVAAGFLEACGLLEEGENAVLLVFYDESLPAFFPTQPYRLSDDKSLAVALWLSKCGEGTSLTLELTPTTGQDGEQPIQLIRLLEFLSTSQAELQFNNGRNGWLWKKNAQAH